MQARIEALSTAIEEAANEAVEAALQAELDSLSMQYASQCMMHMGGMLGTLPNLGDMLSPDKMRPAATPEQEIIRRREAINLMRRQFGDNLSVLRAGVGEREIPVQQAIPIDGRIVVEGGAVATFNRTIKQEISYTVRETYVGNLVITRYYDRIAGRYTGREDYDIQTLSTSIDVLGFDGRGCVKFTGSPSSVCTRWHRFDQWRIGDGEQPRAGIAAHRPRGWEIFGAQISALLRRSQESHRLRPRHGFQGDIAMTAPAPGAGCDEP